MCSTIMQSSTFIIENPSVYKPKHWPKPSNYLPWRHISISQFILSMIFFMYVATIQHLNDSRKKSKQVWKAQSAVYISDTPVTLTLSQGHHIYDENIDPMQGYNQAKFEKSHFNSVWEKGNINRFSHKRKCWLFPLNMCTNQKQ